MIDYIHTPNVHSMEGALTGAKYFFGDHPPASLLDVGCGAGTWMRAALDLGVGDVLGLDFTSFESAKAGGGEIAKSPEPVVDHGLIRQHDLTKPFDLGRKFDAAICLEVAEHLPEENAAALVNSLCAHSDLIYFSAACPGQRGQHHVNCQWPSYWQNLFNRMGFSCNDSIRWLIWHERRIEPWYRQNIFVASKDSAGAGAEPRIGSAIHPDMLQYLRLIDRTQVEDAAMPLGWYIKNLAKAFGKKLLRRLG